MKLDFVILIAIVIILIYAYCIHSQSEHFDTYRNHDFGAYNVYKKTGVKLPEIPGKSQIDQAQLLARYTWSERDPLGYDVYDRMYDAVVRETLNNGDPSYGRRDTNPALENPGVYDTKFSLMDGTNYDSDYNKLDMWDPNLVQTNFHGQQIVLSQKQY